MSIILFIIILATLIVVHELGHFIVAKKAGIRVDEFGLGFGPRITRLFRHNRTDFTLNILPFGGFVKIYGENPDDAAADAKDALIKKPRWVQALVMFAGPFMNFLFAWVIILVTLLSGLPTVIDSSMDPRFVSVGHSLIVDVLPETPAAEAGLVPGDKVSNISVDGENFQNISSVELRDIVAAHPTDEFTFTVVRDETPSDIAVTPRAEGDGARLGVGVETFGIYKPSFGRAFIESFSFTGAMIANIGSTLWHLVADSFAGHADVSNLAGPIGIVGIVGDASRMGFAYLLSFAALISINLGIINLIPFPALDGGRLLFLLIEKIRGGRVNYNVQNWANLVGFILLIALMLFVSYHDIVKLL